MARQTAVFSQPVVRLPSPGGLARRALAWWIRSVAALEPPVSVR
ncbi:MAG TPA: hypothetical protein VMN78_05730 [Longimicrobiales bacterium]|nr:hypothetical protein [Longimicrobiales bacterium]